MTYEEIKAEMELRDKVRATHAAAVAPKQSVERYPGAFSVGPRKVRNAICEDGTPRVATCSASGADTFFSIPAHVHARGCEVSGYVTRDEWGGKEVWLFVAYRYGKNAGRILDHAIPALTAGTSSADPANNRAARAR